MTTLAEIDAAVAMLSKEDQKKLLQRLRERVHDLKIVHDEVGKDVVPEGKRLTVRDMLDNPLDLGEILRPFGPDDDFFDEMMEDRKF